ncbi:MAG: mechanosensitive ion channel [Candidatus Kapaibacterium sp.]|nr:mechanosensitive ion channel [Ignavibacteriota bacterium]MCB9220654.1 mechanosensitive ion channel [Ignavibacteria bacterium]
MTKSAVNKFLNINLFSIYNVDIEIKDIAVLIIFIIAINIVIRIAYRIIFKYSKRDKGSTYSVFKLISYFIWVIGISLYLNAIGIDITFLIASSAALLVGIGIGLQQTFNDLISGIILLFEGSVKVGDIVVINGEFKKIKSIGLRTSRAESFDNSTIIIPNSKIVTENVINYDNGAHPVRFSLLINVGYDSDTQQVKDRLIDLAKTEELVLEEPEPFVLFDNIDENSFRFKLCFFTQFPSDGFSIQSNLRYKVIEEFRKLNITMPYPQRDININPKSLNELLSNDN